MKDGLVSTERSLSTGLDIASVEGLERSGKVWEFKVPRSTFEKWKFDNLVRPLKDYDHATGIPNEEWRFSPQIVDYMNNFLVK